MYIRSVNSWDKPLVSIICPSLVDPEPYLARMDRLVEQSLNGLIGIDQFYVLNPVEYVFIIPASLTWVVPTKPYAIQCYQELVPGIYNALNLGVEKARGKSLVVINIDDWVNLVELAKVANAFLNQSEFAAYGDSKLWESKHTQHLIAGADRPNTIDLARMPGSHQSQLISKSVYDRVGNFHEYVRIGPFSMKLKYASDFEFYCRTIQAGVVWTYDQRIMANQMMGGATSKHWFRTSVEIYFITLKYGGVSIPKIGFLAKCFLGAFNFHVVRRRRVAHRIGER
jgi:hypothetical protein